MGLCYNDSGNTRKKGWMAQQVPWQGQFIYISVVYLSDTTQHLANQDNIIKVAPMGFSHKNLAIRCPDDQWIARLLTCTGT